MTQTLTAVAAYHLDVPVKTESAGFRTVPVVVGRLVFTSEWPPWMERLLPKMCAIRQEFFDVMMGMN